MKFKLGFRQKPDPRDAKYPLDAIMGTSLQKPVSKVWKVGKVLDQGTTSSCVGHACFQFQASEPIATVHPKLSPFDIYGEARKIDEWQDNDDVDAGTSIRAGLNVLKREGIIKSYHWATSAEQCLEFLLKYGPLVFGTTWTQGMYETDANGYVTPMGREDGGHAYFAHSGNWKKREITFINSWGESFGKAGHFKMRMKDIEKLLRDFGACAAAVVEA